MLNAANTYWYVLTSKPREEQRAYDNLISQSYDTFLPKITKVVKKRALKRWHCNHYFPITYLFS
jgi:transcriptional antiterminator RfaH